MSRLSDETALGQPTKYVIFTNSIGTEFTPSEITPLGIGIGHKYKFDVSDITKDDAIKFKGYKTDLDKKQFVEIDIPIELLDNSVIDYDTGGVFGGDILIGAIPSETEWVDMNL